MNSSDLKPRLLIQLLRYDIVAENMQGNRFGIHGFELFIHCSERLSSKSFAAKYFVNDEIIDKGFLIFYLHPQHANLIFILVKYRPYILIFGVDAIWQKTFKFLF